LKIWMRRLLSQTKRLLFCKLGQHDWNLMAVVVQGPSLRYSVITPANVIAERQCAHCAKRDQALYRTSVILQKPKTLPREAA
jgi:hypothetical protein